MKKFKLIAKKWFLTVFISILLFSAVAFFIDGVIVFAAFAAMVSSWIISIPILLRQEIAIGIEKTAEVASNVSQKIDENLSEETKEKIGEALEVAGDVVEVVAEVADALD